jgi:hypothetical protein
MVAVVGVVAAFSQPYRRGGLVAPAKKRKFYNKTRQKQVKVISADI